MTTYTIFIPMRNDPRFGSYHVTMADTVSKAFANVFYRVYGSGIRHDYTGWKWREDEKNNTKNFSR